GLHVEVLHGKGRRNGQYAASPHTDGLTRREYRSLAVSLSTRRREYYLPFQPGLVQAVRKGSFDAVILEGASNALNNIFLARVCRRRGIPYIAWDAGRIPGEAVPFLRRPVRRTLERFYQGAAAIIGYADSSRAYFRSLGIPAHRLWTAYNSVDTRALDADRRRLLSDPAAIRRQRQALFPACDRVLLYIGALEPRKRIDLLFEALDRQPEARHWGLLVVGDGRARQRLERRAAGSHLRKVLFTGAVRADRGRFFLLADAAVFPGSGSLAILDALAYGLPVVAVRAGGPEFEAIEDGLTGLLVQPGDPGHLAVQLLRVGGSPLAEERAIEAARSRFLERYSLEAMARVFTTVLGRVPCAS
ncbi:MAG: glycosyltransferase family 4 protein, partial [Acidobacteriota bacterium]